MTLRKLFSPIVFPIVFYSVEFILLSKVNPHGRPNNHLIVENMKLLRLCGNYVIQTAPNLKRGKSRNCSRPVTTRYTSQRLCTMFHQIQDHSTFSTVVLDLVILVLVFIYKRKSSWVSETRVLLKFLKKTM